MNVFEYLQSNGVNTTAVVLDSLTFDLHLDVVYLEVLLHIINQETKSKEKKLVILLDE